MTDLIEVTALVVAALERVGVPYTVGGSLASSFSGEPRASIDADILVDMTAAQAASFLDALGDQFYAEADALQRAVANKSSTNLIHFESGIKVDLFVAGSLLDAGSSIPRRTFFSRSCSGIARAARSPTVSGETRLRSSSSRAVGWIART